MNNNQKSRPNIEDEISSYYKKGGEIDRLTQGIGLLELARSKEIVSRYLPRGQAIVVDVGGGPGTYACWLAKKGFQVHVVDPIPLYVQAAEQNSNSQPDAPLSSVSLGDARSLEYSNDFADLVLLFGPLYHLTSKADRINALREVRRILRPDGRLLAAAISRFATLNVGLHRDWLADPDFFQALKQEVATGQHRTPPNWPDLFTTAYFHLPTELQDEVTEAGLRLETTLAVEGPGWIAPNFRDQWQDPERKAGEYFNRYPLDTRRNIALRIKPPYHRCCPEELGIFNGSRSCFTVYVRDHYESDNILSLVATPCAIGQ